MPKPDEEDVARWAIPTWALLTLTGEWLEPDRAARSVGTTDAAPRYNTDNFTTAAEQYILGLPPETILVRLNYHHQL